MLTSVKDWLNPTAKPMTGALLLGVLHGLAMTLAFPPVSWWPFALLSAWPLVRLGARVPHQYAGRAALLAAVGTLPFWAWTHQFVLGSSALGFYPLIAYLAIYPGLFVWLLARAIHRFPVAPMWALVPILWVGLEYVRGEVVWNGYAWYLIGQPLIDLPSARQYIPLVGMYGTSAWVTLITGWCFDMTRWWNAPDAEAKSGPPGLRPIGVLLGVGFLLAFTLSSAGLVSGKSQLRVGIVQTNLPQSIKGTWTFEQRLADFERFAELTIDAAADDLGRPADLIIWPETMFPGFWLNAEAVQAEREAALSAGGILTTELYDRLVSLQSFVGIPMIVGSVAAHGVLIDADEQGRVRIKTDREHNSAFVISDGRVLDNHYDKVHLTPFGEVMPYISAWPWLQRRLLSIGAEGMSFGLTPGSRLDPLEVRIDEERSIKVATPICFEATVSGVCRSMTHSGEERRADLIAALTNDGWFHWHNGGRLNHLLVSRWRCAELGVPMARAANTGISALIDSNGNVVALGPSYPPDLPQAGTEGVLVGDLTLPDHPQGTLFSRTGPVVGRVCATGLGALVVFVFAPRRKPKKVNPTEPHAAPSAEPIPKDAESP